MVSRCPDCYIEVDKREDLLIPDGFVLYNLKTEHSHADKCLVRVFRSQEFSDSGMSLGSFRCHVGHYGRFVDWVQDREEDNLLKLRVRCFRKHFIRFISKASEIRMFESLSLNDKSRARPYRASMPKKDTTENKSKESRESDHIRSIIRGG